MLSHLGGKHYIYLFNHMQSVQYFVNAQNTFISFFVCEYVHQRWRLKWLSSNCCPSFCFSFFHTVLSMEILEYFFPTHLFSFMYTSPWMNEVKSTSSQGCLICMLSKNNATAPEEFFIYFQTFIYLIHLFIFKEAPSIYLPNEDWHQWKTPRVISWKVEVLVVLGMC